MPSKLGSTTPLIDTGSPTCRFCAVVVVIVTMPEVREAPGDTVGVRSDHIGVLPSQIHDGKRAQAAWSHQCPVQARRNRHAGIRTGANVDHARKEW